MDKSWKLARKAGEFMNWVDERLPVTQFYNDHLAKYYAPKNFNVWYYMGSLALMVLVMQIVTGFS
jgi:ubiquinol-cytochrome c reductase cytochrome b subunit